MTEKTETPTPPAPGTPEYDAAMIALAEGKVSTVDHDAPPAGPVASTAEIKPNAEQKPQRPECCPEKFWNAETGVVNQEGLAKSYAELERARATPPKQEAKPTPPAGPT